MVTVDRLARAFEGPGGDGRGAERAGDVPGPGVGVVGSRVDGEGVPPVLARRGHHDLDLGGRIDHQRRFDGEVVDDGAPRVGRRLDRELDEPGAREEDGAVDDVVGDPGMLAEREPALEEETAVGQLDRGVEEGRRGQK